MSGDTATGTRDTLALERTRLANERTLLAYFRTALALLAGAAVLLQFFESHHITTAFAWALAVGGLLFLIIGVVRFRAVAARLDRNSA